MVLSPSSARMAMPRLVLLKSRVACVVMEGRCWTASRGSALQTEVKVEMDWKWRCGKKRYYSPSARKTLLLCGSAPAGSQSESSTRRADSIIAL